MTSARDRTLALTGHFVLSPVGPDAETTCAALRAGISRLSASDLYPPLVAGPESEEEPSLVVAHVADLSPDVEGADRLLLLALRALRGLIERTELARADLPRTGLLIALPAPDAAVDRWNLSQTFVPALLTRAGLHELVPSHVDIDQSGHTGVLALVGRAAHWLATGEIEQCIVIGVDSYLDHGRLRALDEGYRLKSERGVDGFVPGEAGAALLIERDVGPAQARRPILARLTLPQQADEPQPSTGELGSTGTGLTSVLRGVVRDLPNPQPLRWFLCNLNGESYRAFEWGLVQTRLAEGLAAETSVQHPADCIGDTGAASGGVLIACATEAFRRKYQRDCVATLWTASDGRARAALLVLPP